MTFAALQEKGPEAGAFPPLEANQQERAKRPVSIGVLWGHPPVNPISRSRIGHADQLPQR
jgi:hypothetical protein